MHSSYLSAAAAVVTEWKHATAYYSTYTCPDALLHQTIHRRFILLRHDQVDLYKNKWRADKNPAMHHHLISSRVLLPLSSLLLLLLLYIHKIIPHIKFPFLPSQPSIRQELRMEHPSVWPGRTGRLLVGAFIFSLLQ